MQREREQQLHDYSTSSSLASRSSSRSCPASDTSTEGESEASNESDTDSEISMKAIMSPSSAAKTLQAYIVGAFSRHSTKNLQQCAAATDLIGKEADAAESQYEPWVLREQWRDCKMLQGVPVDVIAYEETLLRLQMKLDNIQGSSPTEECRLMVRSMRREGVKKIQERLDRVDACKQWWHSQVEVA